jgi:short-subunit dehydrogenase
MNRTILVIGATSAIAHACSRQWAAPGTRFLLAGRNHARLAACAADLVARGAQADTHVVDVADLAAHAALWQRCEASFGAPDIALLAHGTLPDQSACELNPALAAREVSLNATSTIALLTALAPAMRARGAGRIAVITSVAGDRGRASNYVYGSAKAAVTTFCEGLRAALARYGVTVTDIRPGFVDTPMTAHLALPAALLRTPEQIAPAIVAAIERGRAVAYAPWFWRWIMLAIRMLPRPLFHRLGL